MAGGNDKRTPAPSSSRHRKPGARYGLGLPTSSECQKEGSCPSSPSVYIKKSPQQRVTPVWQPKSEDSRMQTVSTVQPLKSVDSPLQMVPPIQPSESEDSLCKLVPSVQVSKSLDPRSTSCSTGAVGAHSAAAPFDICKGESKAPRLSVSAATPPMASGNDKRTPAPSSSSRLRKPGARYGPGLQTSSECQKEGSCSSSPSVYSKKSPQQRVTPVWQPKTEDSLMQTVTTVRPLKSVDSPQQMVPPVQPSESVDSLCKLVPLVQVSKSLDPRSTSCGTGAVGAHSAAAPFDRYKGESKGPHLSVSAATPPMASGNDKRTPAPSSSSRLRKPGARYGPGPQTSSECQKEGSCSSSPSVYSKKSPQQMVTPLQQPKSEDSPLQTVTPVQPLKSLDSPLHMVPPVQPLESVDSLCQMVAQVQISKSLDPRSTSCGTGPVGSHSAAAPFDICKGESKGCFKLNRSMLDINREKRRAKSEPILQRLRPGMVLLKSFLKPDDQVKIVKQCRDLGVGTGGFYQPGYRDGAKLSLRMMCLGKNWDPDSSSYGDIRPFDGSPPPKIPEVLTKFVEDAIDASHAFLKQSGQGTANPSKEIPPMSPDICIANFYTTAGKLGLHQDKDETKDSLSNGLPVVSFSLGETAEFLYGDERDDAKAEKIDLESGDVLIFGGKSRHIFHGVSSIRQNTAPSCVTEEAKLKPGRLNLTFRQYDVSK